MKQLRNQLLLLMVLSTFGCSSEKVATQPAQPVVEQKVSPGPTYVYMGPEWQWQPAQKTYVYVPGEWVEKPNQVWVRGHWKQVRHGWKWVPGYWK